MSSQKLAMSYFLRLHVFPQFGKALFFVGVRGVLRFDGVARITCAANGLTKSRCGVHLVTSTDGRRHCCCCLDTGRRHVASIAVGIIFRPRPKRATSPFRSQFVAQVLHSHAALTHSSHTLSSYTFLIYTLLLMHCTTHALFSHTTLIHRTLTLHS